MTLESQLALSYYRTVADISPEHHVSLVQHRETGKFFVQKELGVYNLSVFQYLQAHPIPGIPQVFEVIPCEPNLIVIEEYISGVTLQEVLDNSGPLPAEQVIDYTTQLCTVLEALHSAVPPIIHRDIKPSNIMLASGGTVMLLDLNAARISDGPAPSDTVLLGTRGYAAPEQYGFGASNVQTDIYALGILMNVLLTGDLSHECTASGSLAPVIRKCIMMDPAERYSSAAEVKAALAAPDTKTRSLRSEKDWRRFLPPGFRTGNPLHMIFAGIGYSAIFALCLTYDTKLDTAAARNFEHIYVLLLTLAVTFFSANYLQVHSHLPLCRSRRLPLRLLGIVIADGVFYYFGIFLMMLLMKNLF